MGIKYKQKNAIAFQGDLSVVTIENLMQLIGHAGLYGELQLETPTNSAVLFVQNGILIYGHLENNQMKIGQRLIEENYITNEQLLNALSLCRTSSSRIGKILVEEKYLRQEDLVEVYKKQVKAVFFEILSWQTGSFSFFVKKISKSEDILLYERIDYLTLEGVLRVDELASTNDDAELDSISLDMEPVAENSSLR